MSCLSLPDQLEEKHSTTVNPNPQKCNCLQRYVVTSNIQGAKRGVQYNFQVFNADDLKEQTPTNNAGNPCCPCKSASSAQAAICRYTFDIPLAHNQQNEAIDNDSESKKSESNAAVANKSCVCKMDCVCSSTQTDVWKVKDVSADKDKGVSTSKNKGVAMDKDIGVSTEDESKTKDKNAKVRDVNDCRRITDASTDCNIDCIKKGTQTDKEKVDKGEGCAKEREKRFTDACVMNKCEGVRKGVQTVKEGNSNVVCLNSSMILVHFIANLYHYYISLCYMD